VLLELGNGNKQVAVPYVGRGDEIGDAANAANTFKENLIRIEKMEAEQKEAEVRAAAQRKADMHKLADEFQAAVGEIVDTVSSASTELEAAAGTLTKTAEVTQELSGTVASASEEASANVQSVASATEEMTSSVNEISRQVQESARIAGDAVKQAQQTDARINELSQAAGRIGDVVKLITSVAEQTNLLALNAAIEAARAGAAGRGFAVVADEVRQLSNLSRETGRKITEKVDVINRAICSASDIATQAAQDDAQAITATETTIQHVLTRFHETTSRLSQSTKELRVAGADIRDEIAEVLVSLQFQDRTSQILTQVCHSLNKFHDLVTQSRDDDAPLSRRIDVEEWLNEMELTYTMQEQRDNHQSTHTVGVEHDITFF